MVTRRFFLIRSEATRSLQKLRGASHAKVDNKAFVQLAIPLRTSQGEERGENAFQLLALLRSPE